MIKLLFGLIFILFIISCEKDATLKSKAYPYLITENLIENDSTGATLAAKVLDEGDEEITDYGFILRDNNDEYTLSIFNKSALTDFNLKISTNLKKGNTYFYRGYIKTSKHIVLANEVTFVAMGSAVIRILGFTPEKGFDNSLVTIHGSNFGNIKDIYQVFINDYKSEIITVTNDSIVFRTPAISYSGDSKISVTTSIETIIAAGIYKVLGPEIDSLSKSEGHSGEYLTIWGKNLMQNGANLGVDFSTFPAEIITGSNQRVDLIIPVPFINYSDLFVDKILPVQLINGLKTTTFSDSFLLKKSWEKKQNPPFITSGYENFVSYNNKGYFLDLNNKKLMEYNPDLNTWSAISAFPGERNDYSHFVVFGDKFFKIGGANTYDFWEYNFITKNWLKRENTQFSFYDATSFILENTLFVVTDGMQVWSFNESDNDFKRMNDFPEKINLFLTYVVQNKACLVDFGKTWEYNYQNDNWTFKSTNPFHNSYYYKSTIGFTLNETCYVLQSGTDLFKYDPLNEEWRFSSIYPYAGQGVYKSSFVINNKAYIAALMGSFPDEYPLLFEYQE